MSDTTQENDPSIEEILASIRQIISDDDEETPEANEEAASVDEPVVEEPITEDEPIANADSEEDVVEEDILDLTEKVEPEPEPVSEVNDDIEVDLAESEDEPDVIEPEPVKEKAKAPDSDLLSSTASTAALAGFTKLARDIQVARTHDGITLEDVVRAQLEPLLREWLDKNLPPMIEVLVEKELEKLSKKVLNS